ncbi:MAG: hypothetical protein E3J47_08275 [Candidatus Stahlbacteria bacterium]|nr:MAG: hypothetical protein E3J47_08275 [Candidatus Stahlbacteria bacterium]
MSDYISSPRPIFHDIEEKDSTIIIGGITSGIVVRITKKGLEINGYYAGLTDQVKFANMKEFTRISWEDLNKMKVEASEGRKKKQTPKKRKCVIDKPDKKYLEKLPVVTLNGVKYYMDMERKERRPVKSPEKVYSFEGLSTRKPT